MSRKTARTIFSYPLYYAKFASIALIFGALVACEDKNDNEPEIPDDTENQVPDEDAESIVGKWQKYQQINDNGSFSPGDLDEFWIFYADGSFERKDGEELASMGTYTIDKDNLSISYVSTYDFEATNLTGQMRFENGYLIYRYTDVGYDDYLTYRFKKMD